MSKTYENFVRGNDHALLADGLVFARIMYPLTWIVKGISGFWVWSVRDKRSKILHFPRQ